MTLDVMLGRQVRLSATVALIVCACSTRLASGSENQDAVLQSFRFDRKSVFVTLPVTLQGKQHLFIVDTGSSHTCYSTALRGALGESLGTLPGLTPNGPASFSMFDAPVANVGNLPLHTGGEMVACADLSRHAKSLNFPLAGIVGMTFLRRHRIEVDFQNGTLAFLRSIGPRKTMAFKRIPIRFKGDNIPQVEATLSGYGAMMRIDTGHEGTGHLGDALGTHLYDTRRINVAGMRILSGITGREILHTFRCDEVELSEFTHSNLVFSARIQDHDTPKAGRSRFGLDYLRRFHIIFDFPSRQLFLRPSREYALKDNSDCGGMLLQTVGGHVTVTHVVEGTKASALGIKPGDRLLRVGNRRSSSSSFKNVASWVTYREEPVRLELSRKGSVYAVTLP